MENVMDRSRNRAFQSIQEGQDFKKFVNSIMTVLVPGTDNPTRIDTESTFFDELIKCIDDRETTTYFRTRIRQSYSKTFCLLYALHTALYGSDGDMCVIVSGKKADNDHVLKLLIRLIHHNNDNQPFRINFVLNEKHKEGYIDMVLTTFTGHHAFIRFMIVTNKIDIISRLQAANIKLLCPIDAPYTSAYAVIRRDLLNTVKNSGGIELILSNGGSTVYQTVRYFSNIRTDEDVNYSKLSLLDVNASDEQLLEVFSRMNYDTLSFAKEYLCEFVHPADFDESIIPQFLLDAKKEYETKRMKRLEESGNLGTLR